MNLMNKTRVLELLQKEAVLQFDNQSLYKVDNSENSEYSELILYRIVLEEQIFYKNQSHYIDLVKKCLDGEINCYEFQWDFFEIYYADMGVLLNVSKK